jgi:hypothetical protein
MQHRIDEISGMKNIDGVYQLRIQPAYLVYYDLELAYAREILNKMKGPVEKRQTFKTITICALASIAAAGAVVFFLKKR